MSFVMYADDSNVFYSHKCLKTLLCIIQKEMNEVLNWLNANKLSINTRKTKFIIFTSQNKKCNSGIDYRINDNALVNFNKLIL